MGFLRSRAAWEVDGLEPVDRLVLLALADVSDEETGWCFPSWGYLVKRTGLSERGVRYACKRLMAAGLVEVKARFDGMGRQRSNGFIVMGGGGTKCHPEGAPNATLEPINKEPTTKILPSVESSRRGSRFALSMVTDVWVDEARRISRASDEAIREQMERFVDYWCAVPGQKGVKLDWLATWRNWCRNAKWPKDKSSYARAIYGSVYDENEGTTRRLG